VAKELGRNFRNLRLSQLDPTELIGFPTRKKELIVNADGKEGHIEYLDYDPPRWFVEAMKGDYIIFLDELNRAKPDVVNAAFELVQERELNGRKLPDSVLIIVACNPDSTKYTTNSVFDDEALSDRFCHIKVESNFDVWKTWARHKEDGKKQNISSAIINYLSSSKNSNAFDYVDSQDQETPFSCKPSPRSWEKVEDIISLNITTDHKQELLEGIIGVEHASAFIASLSARNKPITAEQVFEMSPETITMIKSYSEALTDGPGFGLQEEGGEKIVEVALLNATCEALTEDDDNLKSLVREHYANVFRFLQEIPADLSQKTLKKLCTGPDNRKFWELKLFEPELNAKGQTIKVKGEGDEMVDKLRWPSLVASLEELAKARDNLSKKVSQSSGLTTKKS
jgi:hypothetical protein